MTANLECDLVILLDLDNTLIDHDEFKLRLGEIVSNLPGGAPAERFWESYEVVRRETGIVNVFETVARYSRECSDARTINAALDERLHTYPFEELLYEGTLPALDHLSSLGTLVILCDGDPAYQRYKVRSAGIDAFVGERVLVYEHKEEHAEEIVRLFPAAHYALIDDKARIHHALKQALADRITTIQVLQGHYGAEPAGASGQSADLRIARLADLAGISASELIRLGAEAEMRGGDCGPSGQRS